MDFSIYILKVGFGQLVLFGMYFSLLRRLTFFKLNRLFLLSCLFVPLLLPFIKIPAMTSFSLGAFEVWSQGVEIVNGTKNASINSPFNWFFFLKLIYGMGILLSSILLGNKLLNIRRLIKMNPKTKINNRHWIVVEELGIASFFNYLFAPSNFLEQANHQAILAHEEVHISQKHSIDVLITEVFQIFFWFNPIIYFIKKAIVLNHEYLADDGATNKSTNQKPYIKLLINNNLQKQLQLGNAFFNPQLKNRITMLQQKKSNPLFKIQYLSLLIAVGGILFLFSCEQDLEPENNQTQQSKFENNNVKDSDDFTENQNEDPFVIVEDMPEFIGGEQKMMKYLYSNITYPAIARDNGIEGLCVISFVVNEDGSLSDVIIRRDIGGGCGDEAVRVIKSMPNWKPGKQRGKVVKVSYNLPVRFKLQ